MPQSVEHLRSNSFWRQIFFAKPGVAVLYIIFAVMRDKAAIAWDYFDPIGVGDVCQPGLEGTCQILNVDGGKPEEAQRLGAAPSLHQAELAVVAQTCETVHQLTGRQPSEPPFALCGPPSTALAPARLEVHDRIVELFSDVSRPVAFRR